MTILLLMCGLVAVALPALRPHPLIEASPRWFARLASVTVVIGLVCILTALALSTAVGGLHLLRGTPSEPVDHLAPEGVPGSLVAAALLAWIATRCAMFTSRSARARSIARADGWLGQHEPMDDHDLVVLPTVDPVAYNVPGRRAQVVISEGLAAQLDDEMLRFVIDHERAHLRAKDRRNVLVALALETAVPFVPWTTRTATSIRVAVERAADEEAAGVEPTRRRRLARDIEGLAPVLGARCGTNLVRFRSRHLASAPAESRTLVVLATAGIAAVTAVAASVALHASDDVSPYLALL